MIHHEEHRAHEGKDICDSILSWINLFALFEVFVVKNGLVRWYGREAHPLRVE